MSLRSALYRASTGFRGLRDRALYPEAPSAGEQWQRVALDRAVDARIAALDPSSCSAVEISGENHAGRPWRKYTSLSFPDFDLCAPLETTETFDVVICEQVLEHVVDPGAAVANLTLLCEPGGMVIVSTPFLVKIHEIPYYMLDYWRFTPRGLQVLLEGAGLEVETVESWGNRQSVAGNIKGWSAYRRWHSLANEPDVPLQVWAFARRPAD